MDAHLEVPEELARRLATALTRLRETNFRVSTDLVSALLAEDAERHRRTE